MFSFFLLVFLFTDAEEVQVGTRNIGETLVPDIPYNPL